MPEPKRPGAPAPAEPTGAAQPLAFLADRDAFFRRFVLSLILQPPPSLRRRGR
jgi:hypothetical protein